MKSGSWKYEACVNIHYKKNIFQKAQSYMYINCVWSVFLTQQLNLKVVNKLV